MAWGMAVYRRLYSNYHGVLPYAICEMTPKKNGGHIKSAQMTARNVCVGLANGLNEPYQALSSASTANNTVNFAEKYH